MSYIINTIEDLEKVLRENPEWRERIRVLILDEELRRLPQRFERFVEEEFRPLKKDVEVLKQDMTEVKKDVDLLKKEVGVLKMDVASLRGDNFERKVRENAPAFLGRVIRRLRPIDKFALADILDDAVDKGLISEEEREFAIKVDFVGKGRLKDSGKEVYVALEANLSLYPEDVGKVFKRAIVISRAVEQETIPVVVFVSASEDALALAEELGVLTVKTITDDA